MYEGIFDALHRELELLDEKYESGKNALSGQDLEHIDMIAHALKSLKAYDAMVDGYRTRRRYEDRRY